LNRLQYWTSVRISNIGLFWLAKQSRRLQKRGWLIVDTERKRKRKWESVPERHLPILLPYLKHWGLWYQSFLWSTSKDLARSTFSFKGWQKQTIQRRINIGALHNWRD
jgi:hypothetical protein